MEESARRCGKKHISKSKVLKTDDLGPLLEFKMSEKSARHCGAEHVSKSKVLTDDLGPLLEVEMSKKVHAAVAPGTFPSLKCEKLTVSDHLGPLLEVEIC